MSFSFKHFFSVSQGAAFNLPIIQPHIESLAIEHQIVPASAARGVKKINFHFCRV